MRELARRLASVDPRACTTSGQTDKDRMGFETGPSKELEERDVCLLIIGALHSLCLGESEQGGGEQFMAGRENRQARLRAIEQVRAAGLDEAADLAWRRHACAPACKALWSVCLNPKP